LYTKNNAKDQDEYKAAVKVLEGKKKNRDDLLAKEKAAQEIIKKVEDQHATYEQDLKDATKATEDFIKDLETETGIKVEKHDPKDGPPERPKDDEGNGQAN
jgi:hypothetical protein